MTRRSRVACAAMAVARAAVGALVWFDLVQREIAAEGVRAFR